MRKLIIVSNRQAVKQHIARVFDGTQWSVMGMSLTKTAALMKQNRLAVVLFHLDQFTTESVQLIEQFVFDWPVCVLGPALTAQQFNHVWKYPICDYVLWDTPSFILLKKMNQIAELRLGISASTPRVFHSVQFDASQGLIVAKSQVMHLSKLENELVSVLFAQHGSYVPRLTLLDTIWPVGAFASNDALDVLIRRTRLKLAAIGIEIKVKRGFGYQMVIQE